MKKKKLPLTHLHKKKPNIYEDYNDALKASDGNERLANARMTAQELGRDIKSQLKKGKI